MGGEHCVLRQSGYRRCGSSPRGRGTLKPSRKDKVLPRIIPAWAGNTLGWIPGRFRVPDHPRVGGEHWLIFIKTRLLYGSSPRGRGTPGAPLTTGHSFRIIPAWAGNTRDTAPSLADLTDHPRVGGEHATSPATSRKDLGSSPRGRGTPAELQLVIVLARIIPAWAGNTELPSLISYSMTDHPRVGGEHSPSSSHSSQKVGSSPRGRGTPPRRGSSWFMLRIIPAWAGNTFRRWTSRSSASDHPRVGGEHLIGTRGRHLKDGSSPRGRGTLHGKPLKTTSARIIPAWAGNTLRQNSGETAVSDHPRVGGEHRAHRSPALCRRGSSPRGRGTHLGSCGRGRAGRIIPAWAGNTEDSRSSDNLLMDHPRVGGEH